MGAAWQKAVERDIEIRADRIPVMFILRNVVGLQKKCVWAYRELRGNR